MKYHAVITGDVINSRKLHDWLPRLKEVLGKFGTAPDAWDIYRGDAFQLAVPASEGLLSAIRIKAYFRAINADVRMAVGIGEKTEHIDRVMEDNGSAFIRSGERFESLKSEGLTLAVNTPRPDINIDLNLKLELALTIMDSWLEPQAEFVAMALENPDLPQEALGKKLGISQAAVSRRRKRSHLDLILKLDNYFRRKIRTL